MKHEKKALLKIAYQRVLAVTLLDLKAPLKWVDEYVSETVTGFGTAADEKFSSIEGYRAIIVNSRKQAKGLAFNSKSTTKYKPRFTGDNTACFIDELVVTIGKGSRQMVMHLSVGLVFHFLEDKWKLIALHAAKIDTDSSAADTFHLGEAEKKMQALQLEVAKRTEELSQKNKDLKIEAALERVRAVAMAMQQPEDMLNICKNISHQLQSLGLKEIRNIQTAIFYPQRGSYMNYEYYAKHDKTFITDVAYKDHKIQIAFARKMMKGANEQVVEQLKGAQLKEWYNYQKTTNQFADKYILTAHSLNYYWYSIGPVALGISTYAPLNKEDLNLFQRFLKVFELAYRRYLDIEKAEAQAREAQIEAALERIRTASLAMQDSAALGEIIYKLYGELTKLDAKLDRCFIMIVHPENNGITWWLAGKEGLLAENGFFIQMNQHPSHLMYLDHWKKRKKKWQYLFEGKGKAAWDRFGFTKTALARLPDFIKKDMAAVRKIHLAGSSDQFGSLVTGSIEPLPEAQQEIINRFARAFNQAYVRFLDLQKAEAQAREAQIEAALERVRAQSMAMHTSNELGNVVFAIDREAAALGIKVDNTSIITDFELREHGLNNWLAASGKQFLEVFHIPYKHTGLQVVENIYTAIENGVNYYSDQYTRAEKNKYFRWLFKHSDFRKISEERKAFVFSTPGWTRATVLLKNSILIFQRYSLIGFTEEESAIFKRFGVVFDQTYTRFLDLQKAEAQAREAQVEAALERVRSRSMAMHDSKELGEVAKVMFNQMKMLGGELFAFGIVLCDKDKNVVEQWHGLGEGDMMTPFQVPVDLDYIHRYRYNQWKAGVELFSIEIPSDYIARHFELMFALPSVKMVMDDLKSKGIELAHPSWEIDYGASFRYGYLLVSSLQPFTEENIFPRFAKVFDQAYTRFLDLQKAEAQAREAKIEASLERVRSHTMGLRKSEELVQIINVIFDELKHLGLNVYETGIYLRKGSSREFSVWAKSITEDEFFTSFDFPFIDHPILNKVIDNLDKQKSSATFNVGGEDLKTYLDLMFSIEQFKVIQPETKASYYALDTIYVAQAYFQHGFLEIAGVTPIAEDLIEVGRRFTQVIDLAYTRFLDLQKAEAQTREAQIQLALERVRARSLAMHHTSELQDVVDVVAQQLHHIGIDINGGVFIVINEEVNNDLPIWASAGAADYLQKVIVPFFNKRIFVHLRDAFKKRNYFFEETYTKKEKDDMFRHLFKFPPWRTMSATRKRELLAREGGLTRLAVISQYTSIALTNHNGKQFSEADKEILKRFGTVFEQAYTRFLDLQKAEAQAREAQIEASLEKVRSVAMGMHKAADLLDICETSYAELIKLGFTELRNTMINIHDDAEETFLNYDYSVYAGKAVTKYGYHIHPVIRNLVSKSRAAQDAFVDIGLYGSEFDEWKKFRSKSGEQDDDRLNSINHLNYYFYSIGIGSIGISTFESISEQKLNTLKRFRNVFQLAYQRFTDLTLAEAQAREAQIETALERVRARTMAMQKSEELSAVAHVLFEEFKQLNLSLGDKLSRAFVITVDEEKKSFQFFITTSEGNYLPVVYPLPFKEKTNGVLLANCWHSGEAMLINVIEGAAYKQWLKYLDSIQLYISPEIKALKKRVNHYVRFSKGFLGITANEVLEDDAVTLLQRFAKVFDQTFTRFVDLQIAEASAKEAIKQAALDRIRANIASMRRVEDLDRITPIIWNELRVLGIPFVRCGIFIMDESLQQIHTFLSSPNGGHIAAYYMRFQETPHIYAMVEHWRKHAKFIERWTLSEFTLLATSLYQQGAIKDQAQYLQSIPADGMWLHFIPFIQGMLYVGNESSLPEDAIDTLAAVADAFSTAYARYEDFNKLEQAKTQVENTLVDLKQAQKQLVQSEKMASLGELTAGIAHEIQNPLNFVNNFSEVTQELLEELRQELKHGNTDGVQDLMDDIIQNLEKINHHGKRADGIVKGMLQHSRTSSGQKELVDINILCDEYLRLSYHGLRAKDKSFNAKFETSFDDTITKVNVMPQEMGRVILNLINNAFYAVSKKQQDGAADYVPTVRISTQKAADKILISVQDNGMGIPEQIKDKIFQPFFTTKPTGQGTGLGLSLSYDIVKAHGGEIQINSEQGVGTIFQIILPV